MSLRNRIRKKKKERRRTLIQSSIETYRSNSSREVETKSKSLGLCIDGKCNEREKSSLSFFFFNGEDSHVLNRGRRKTDRTGYTGYENPSSIPSLPWQIIISFNYLSEFLKREKKKLVIYLYIYIYIPRYNRFQPWIDTPSLIDFSRAHLWRDWRWSRASLPSKRCQSPGETFFFSRTTYRRTLYRTVVASCLINLFYLCHTRVHGSNFG